MCSRCVADCKVQGTRVSTRISKRIAVAFLLIVDAFKTALIVNDGVVRYQSVLHPANRRARICTEGERLVGQE
jgi:hypothetical protein